MSDEWFSGDTPNIAYCDPLCRLAYLYCHVAANANLFEFVLRSTPDVRQLINERLAQEEELKVCAFGGGPGTELLALSKYLLKIGRTPPPASISFTILDRVPEWAESWTLIEKEVTNYLRMSFGHLVQRPFSIGKSFCPFDMTKLEQFGNLVDLFGQDLFVMNYVVSEILGDSQKLEAVVDKMAESAPAGAIFLIVDREQDNIIDRAKTLLAGAGLNPRPIQSTRSYLDTDEQTSDLEPYVTMIGRRPRATWGNRTATRGAFWTYGRKE